MAMLKYSYIELSGAVQQRTTSHIKKPNEVVNVVNGDFWTTLGAVARRPGSQSTVAGLPKLQDSNPTLAAYIARFPGLVEIWASNNISGSESVLKYFNGTTFVPLMAGLPLNAELNFANDVDEVWVGAYDPATDTVGNSFTVDSAHSASLTRQLQFGPEARFFIEFNGAVYGFNVLVNGVRYRDRAYKSSGLTGVISFVRAPGTLSQSSTAPGTYTMPLDIDSVRYLKPTMDIDIYKAGTETLLYQVTIAAVDKILDNITITPPTLNFAATDIVIATDIITVPSNTWMTSGTSITLWSPSGAPGGLSSGTVYYVVRLTATTIKLATTYANALAGTPVTIDITSQGTGTHQFTLALVLGNKDEIWGRGRKGKLTRYWNTDYRNPEVADWMKIPATLDAVNDIVAVGKLSGRMFMFTENSMISYDGANRVVLKNDVGCISQKTICYYDSFMAWMDSKGQIWYRNEEAGEMDVISLPVEKMIKQFTQAELKAATVVCVGPIMKIYIGRKDGSSLRLIYHFQANQWSFHWHASVFSAQLEYLYAGVVKPHWFDEVGQMWVDEVGNDDNGATIPFEVEIGDDSFGVDEIKTYMGVKLYSKYASSTKVYAAIDGGDPKEVGQIGYGVQSIDFSDKRLKGTLIDLSFKNSASGEPCSIEKVTVFYQKEEDTLRASIR